MLTPEFQADSGGFGSYQRFWNGIRVRQPLRDQGGSQGDDRELLRDLRERRTAAREIDNVTLELVQQDGKYLIAGEQ